jgi:hypothetical protein
MHCRDYYYWILPLCVSVVVGCQASDEVLTAVPTTAAIAKPSAKTGAQDKAVATPALATDKPEPAAVAQFSPPFPDRIELFEPPKRAQGTIRQDDQNGETVELKGFVNVDRPRVVLSIDGVIAPISEGGEKYGVQVISIQPPSVVLQRGRSRWTATLE